MELNKEKVVKVLGAILAETARKSDYFKYKNDIDTVDSCESDIYNIKKIATIFGIQKDVYNRAYKIYDFRRKNIDTEEFGVDKCLWADDIYDIENYLKEN